MPAAASPSIPSVVAAYRAAVERGDIDAVRGLLAPDIALHFPVTERVRFQGRDEVEATYRDMLAVLRGFETDEPLVADTARTFVFRAHVRHIPLEGMMLVRCNADGLIADLTLYGRPLSATATLFAAMAPRITARRRGPLMGALVALVLEPVALIVRLADLAAPRFV